MQQSSCMDLQWTVMKGWLSKLAFKAVQQLDPNLFIYLARESSLVPAVFLTNTFLQKMYFWSFVVIWDLGWTWTWTWTCSALLASGKEKCRNLWRLHLSNKRSFSSRHSVQISSILPCVLHHNNGFINVQLLQKLDCQKPCWDQARLSSPLNRHVAVGQLGI